MKNTITTTGLLCLLCLMATAWGCRGKAGKGQGFTFHDRLSQHGFFKGDMSALEPTDGVVPYTLNTPLFTDYAYKARFIKVPDGKPLTLKSGALAFPEGTVLIKNFFYHRDERNMAMGRQIIETRLLVKQRNRWAVATYVWDEGQQEAFKTILGATKPVAWVDSQGRQQAINYVVPDNNDCKSCHKNNGEVTPIGPTVANLNKVMAGKKSGSQLRHLASLGVLKGPINADELPRLPVWDDSTTYSVDQRARAYLDVNCAHCHNAAGPANNTGLFLEFDQQAPSRLGICKGPVSAAQGSGNLKYDIVPGNPAASILHYRMAATAPGVAMPELGRTVVHAEGVALIKAWITGMEGDACD